VKVTIGSTTVIELDEVEALALRLALAEWEGEEFTNPLTARSVSVRQLRNALAPESNGSVLDTLCTSECPNTPYRCMRELGHTGDHKNGSFTWPYPDQPDLCLTRKPDSHRLCLLWLGHSGEHRNEHLRWS